MFLKRQVHWHKESLIKSIKIHVVKN